jgi:hypothetical protein
VANHGRQHWYRFDDTEDGWKAQQQWRNWRSGWPGKFFATGSEDLPGLLFNTQRGGDRAPERLLELADAGALQYLKERDDRLRASGQRTDVDPLPPRMPFLRQCLLSHYMHAYSDDYLRFCRQRQKDCTDLTAELNNSDSSAASTNFVTAALLAYEGKDPGARAVAAGVRRHRWARDWLQASGFDSRVRVFEKLLLMGEEFASCAAGHTGDTNSRVAVWYQDEGKFLAWHGRIQFYVEHRFNGRPHRLALLRYHQPAARLPHHTDPLVAESYGPPSNCNLLERGFFNTSTQDLTPVHRFSHRWIAHVRSAGMAPGPQRIDVCPLRMRWH